MRKPRIFIASSVESLDVADAINVNLDHQAEVTVWKNGFKLSSGSIESLLEKADAVDFAIFVFTPDDLAIIRSEEKLIIRDNVLFELGLFIGTLGKDRCFIVKPRNEELHLPTDLLGLSPADYEGNRSDDDLTSAVNHPCVLIKKEIAERGLISENLDIHKSTRKRPNYKFEIGDIELRLLSKTLENYAAAPDGVSVWECFRSVKGNDGELGLASIKLERLGFLEKGIATDQNGYDYYTFILTADGIDYLLENEQKLKESGKIEVLEDPDEIPF